MSLNTPSRERFMIKIKETFRDVWIDQIGQNNNVLKNDKYSKYSDEEKMQPISFSSELKYVYLASKRLQLKYNKKFDEKSNRNLRIEYADFKKEYRNKFKNNKKLRDSKGMYHEMELLLKDWIVEQRA